MEADLVVIGPGNYYSSIVSSLLIKGIADALSKTRAKIVYNCNLTNKPGQTENFGLDEFIRDINNLIGKERVDFVTFNTRKPDSNLLEKYGKQKETLVKFDLDDKKNRKYKIIRADILSTTKFKYSSADKIASTRSFIRHDSDKLAKILMMILELGEYENIIKEIV